MAPLIRRRVGSASGHGLDIVPPDADICLKAGLLDWSRRDPSDRLIAATMPACRATPLSVDTAFDGIVPRVW